MNNKRKTEAETRQFVYKVAEYRGWVVNPDGAFLADIIKGLQTNYNRYGYFLCPCRDGEGDRQADKDIICPCDYNIPDQVDYGHCFCGLFLSREFAESGQQVRPIPERRASF
ncbi:MAG: ferredoxin-thioredoxin reductase catalytic domain-containing protein [Alkalispirochaetaceae bacterium]